MPLADADSAAAAIFAADFAAHYAASLPYADFRCHVWYYATLIAMPLLRCWWCWCLILHITIDAAAAITLMICIRWCCHYSPWLFSLRYFRLRFSLSFECSCSPLIIFAFSLIFRLFLRFRFSDFHFLLCSFSLIISSLPDFHIWYYLIIFAFLPWFFALLDDILLFTILLILRAGFSMLDAAPLFSPLLYISPPLRFDFHIFRRLHLIFDFFILRWLFRLCYAMPPADFFTPIFSLYSSLMMPLIFRFLHFHFRHYYAIIIDTPLLPLLRHADYSPLRCHCAMPLSPPSPSLPIILHASLLRDARWALCHFSLFSIFRFFALIFAHAFIFWWWRLFTPLMPYFATFFHSFAIFDISLFSFIFRYAAHFHFVTPIFFLFLSDYQIIIFHIADVSHLRFSPLFSIIDYFDYAAYAILFFADDCFRHYRHWAFLFSLLFSPFCCLLLYLIVSLRFIDYTMPRLFSDYFFIFFSDYADYFRFRRLFSWLRFFLIDAFPPFIHFTLSIFSFSFIDIDDFIFWWCFIFRCYYFRLLWCCSYFDICW